MSDIWRVQTVFAGASGLPGVSTLYWERHDGAEPIPGTRDPVDVVTDVHNFWQAICTGFGSSSGGLRSGLTATTIGVLTRYDSETGEATAFDDGGPDQVATGNGTSEPLPPFTQTLVQLHTGHFRRGRELHGRIFIPGLTEDHGLNGAPTTTWMAGVKSEVDDMIGHGLIVWGRPIPLSESGPAAAGDFASVSSCAVWSKFAVLRSRRD